MRLRFFAQARDAAGCETFDLEVGELLSEEQLWRVTTDRFPRVGSLRASLRIARNLEYTMPGERFANDDEVAFLPPVSGG